MTRSNTRRVGGRSRIDVLLAVAAMTLGACTCPKPKRAEPSPEPRPVAAAAAAPVIYDSGHRHGPLGRPDLSADWNWNGQALPTGDLATSVLTLEKIGPASVNANADFDYRIRVANIAATMHLVDVVVTDHLPASGYTFTSATPAADRSGDNLTWNLGHLAPGETREILVRGRATAVGTLQECATVVYTPQVCVFTDVVAAALELQKYAPVEVVQCDDIPLRFVVRNPGTGDARNVRIDDQLPDGWTVNGSRSLSFDVGTLKGGESRELTAIARASGTGEFVNRATATADGDLKSEASAPTAVRKPKLEITKTASSTMEVLGREGLFTITVKNVGDYPARDTVLTDSVAGADRIVTVSDGGTVSGGTITWQLGIISPGVSRTVTVAASRLTPGWLENTATASAYCADPVSASAKLEYRGVPAVLLEVVDDPDPVLIGSTTTYTITVTNQGSAEDSDIIITCALEDAVEYVSGSGATLPTRSGANVTFAPLNNLAPKAVATWTVTVRGVKAGDTRFKVALTTRETGRPIEESEATRIYE